MGKLNRERGDTMLIIFCAELEEAQHIKCPEAKIIITGAGLCNVIQTPRINVNPGDTLINIGYAGSTEHPVGEVRTVNACRRLKASKTVKEHIIYTDKIKSLASAVCHTADDFVDRDEVKGALLPLVDMELYYLASIYPQMRAIKIISDNLSYNDYKECNLETSWTFVNTILNEWNI